VGLDARLVSGERGGVEQVIIGLASSFSRLADGDEQYLFLVDRDHTKWIEPHVFGPCSLLISSGAEAAASRRGPGAVATATLKAAIPHPIRAAIGARRPRPYRMAESDGAIERAGVDVMHFPMQVGFRTSVPTIFAPHDLQHLHLPQFFTTEQIVARERSYRALCAQASIVTLMSSWGRDDIVARYGLDPGKILIVPGAPATSAYDPATDDDVLAVRERLGLPGQFAVYPAKAWPHKNHLRLVAALKVLRDRGVDVPIVMTGAQDGRDRPVMAAAEADGVSDLVHFTGFVEPADLNAIYRAARMMVFPSLFEGWGLPVLEALAAGLPLACSQVTCLPAITAGAADLFDPYDPAAIAGAIERVWLDHGTRARLTTAGRIRAARFSWDLSARMFRACYRLLGGRALSPEDQALLDAPPLA
jgi:glycosyltransferase involved in cell wall biosynthesis